MDATSHWIAALERVNYEAALATAQVTPGFDLVLRDDVIITSSEVFPSPDTTHACLLRSMPHAVDSLIAEIITYFRSKNLPITIFVSPACTPPDLSEQLLDRGFVRQETEEAWLSLNLLTLEIPPPVPGIEIRPVTEVDALTFAQVFMAAFDLPPDAAPYMAQLMMPSVGLPGVYHYLAVLDEQPLGICSMICHGQVGILGSAGVIPTWRGSGVIRNLIIQAVSQARLQEVETVILQTTAGTSLERLLRLHGFKRAFTRVGFTLSS